MKNFLIILFGIILIGLSAYISCSDPNDYNNLTSAEYRQILSEGKR